MTLRRNQPNVEKRNYRYYLREYKCSGKVYVVVYNHILPHSSVHFKDYKEEFWPLLENLIDEIFDENIPFTPSKNEDSCKFCELLDICNKELKN